MPKNIGAAMTEKDGFLDTFLTQNFMASIVQIDRIERYQRSMGYFSAVWLDLPPAPWF